LSQGKRLFLAVDLDAITREQATRVGEQVRFAMKNVGRVTWVRAEALHLTLFFFPAADPVLEQRIASALVQPLSIPTFELSFEGLGFFPSQKTPRVLWLGVGLGRDELVRLHAEFARRLDSLAPAEPFTPHLTLARFREQVKGVEMGRLTSVEASAGPTWIERVTLYESHLSSAGPLHEPRGEARLS
jgi:2'-5' RNA ligase